jgi:hypothetical protein
MLARRNVSRLQKWFQNLGSGSRARRSPPHILADEHLAEACRPPKADCNPLLFFVRCKYSLKIEDYPAASCRECTRYRGSRRFIEAVRTKNFFIIIPTPKGLSRIPSSTTDDLRLAAHALSITCFKRPEGSVQHFFSTAESFS